MSLTEELSRELRSLVERLDALAQRQSELREDFNAQMSEFRQEMARLRQDFNTGVLEIRREQTKMWEGIRDLTRQMSEFRQEMARLREDMAKGFERHEAELSRLREDFNRMMEVVEGLQRQHRALERRLDSSIASLTSAMVKGFAELGKFAGISFEEFVRVFLSEWLRSSGYIPRDAELRSEVVDGEEINLFFEDPLIVGEVTAHAKSEEELKKLERKAEVASKRFGRRPRKFLIVLKAPKDVARRLRRMARERGVELILGGED